MSLSIAQVCVSCHAHSNYSPCPSVPRVRVISSSPRKGRSTPVKVWRNTLMTYTNDVSILMWPCITRQIYYRKLMPNHYFTLPQISDIISNILHLLMNLFYKLLWPTCSSDRMQDVSVIVFIVYKYVWEGCPISVWVMFRCFLAKHKMPVICLIAPYNRVPFHTEVVHYFWV